MATPDRTDSFLTVSLHLAGVREDAETWGACENARARSAVSRAYYSGFIDLKLRLLPVLNRKGREFPEVNAHSRVIHALKRAGHAALALSFQDLRWAREEADYAWGARYSETSAGAAITKAKAVAARVHALSDPALTAIAKHL